MTNDIEAGEGANRERLAHGTWEHTLSELKAMSTEELRAELIVARFRWAGGKVPSDREREIVEARRAHARGWGNHADS